MQTCGWAAIYRHFPFEGLTPSDRAEAFKTKVRFSSCPYCETETIKSTTALMSSSEQSKHIPLAGIAAPSPLMPLA